MVTSRDVARLAGVSQSTVSYVLNGNRPISDEVRRRVEESIAKLTYQPNAGARALASRRTQVIGLVVPFSPAASTSGLLPFIETIASGVREHDFDVLLVTADEGPSALTRLEGRVLCDAIVVMEVEAHDPRITVASDLRVPVVLVGVPADRCGLTCVDVDFEAMARMAVTDLTSRGHDRLVIIGHTAETIDRQVNYVRRFEDSARACAHELNIPLQVVAPVAQTREGVSAALDRAGLDRPGRLGLIIAAGGAAQPVLHDLTRRGITPGRDLSVIAIATDAVAEATEPPVTNLSQEPRDVSRRVVDAVFRLLDTGTATDTPGVELVPPRLTHRETTMTDPGDVV